MLLSSCRWFLVLLVFFPSSSAEDYVYTVKRTSAPNPLFQPKTREPGPERRAWNFQPKAVLVDGVVKERMANTKVTFTSDPIAAHMLAEVTMRIPEKAYVNHLEMRVAGETYVGVVMKRADARQEFHDALNSGDSASLVESKGSAFTVLITLEAGESAEVTVRYEEYLALHLGSYDYNLALDTRPDVNAVLPSVLVQIAVEDSDGLHNIAVPKPNFDCAFQASVAGNNFQTCGLGSSADKAWIKYNSLQNAEIVLQPTQEDQRSTVWGGSAQGLSLDLIVRVTPLNTFAADAPNGGVMMIDESSGHFVHVFSAPQTAPMRKAVVLMMDRSGSMGVHAGGRTRMQQAQEAARGFLERLDADDLFSLGMFNSRVEWWETPHLKPASPANVRRAVEWLTWYDASGGTDINQALVESLAVFSGGDVSDYAGHYESFYDFTQDAVDPCEEWEDKAWQRSWGGVTAACCVMLTAVFITSIGVAGTAGTAKAALNQRAWTHAPVIPPAHTHPHPALPVPHAASAPSPPVMVLGGNMGGPLRGVSTPDGRPLPLVGTWVQGASMGALDEEAGAPEPPPLTNSTNNSYPLPSAPPEHPPCTSPQYNAAPAGPAQSQPPAASDIPLAQPAILPPPTTSTQHMVQMEAQYFRGALVATRRWAISLLVFSALALALSWSTFLVPLALAAAIFGIVTAAIVLHAVRRNLASGSAESNVPCDCCGCCGSWAGCMGSACGLAVTTSVLAGLAWVLCLIWAIVLITQGQSGHRSCFPEQYDNHTPDQYYDSYSGEYDGPVEYVAPADLASVLEARNGMVVFLSDGHATSGVQHRWEIAEHARQQVGHLPSGQKAAVFGVGFGRDADLDLLQLVSKGTGAVATRIYDDNDMDVQLSALLERVSAAVITGLDLQYSALADAQCESEACMQHCAASTAGTGAGAVGGGDCLNCVGEDSDMSDMCAMTLQPQTTLFSNSVVVRAGRLPELPGVGRARAVSVVVSGRWEGQMHKMCDADYCHRPVRVTFGPGQSNTIEGERAGAAGQIWSHLTVHEALQACPLVHDPNESYLTDVPRWTMSGCAWGVPPEVVETATALAVQSNLVTPLTSLVVRRQQPSPPSTTPPASTNATAATAGQDTTAVSETPSPSQDAHDAGGEGEAGGGTGDESSGGPVAAQADRSAMFESAAGHARSPGGMLVALHIILLAATLIFNRQLC